MNRIRAIRKAAEEDRNHDLEHDLFIEERKAQRGLSFGQPLEALKTGSWRNWPRNTTQLIANFPGSSLWALGARRLWPQFCAPFLCWLVLSLVIFPWWYSQILPVPLRVSLLDAYKYEQAVQLVARANAVPFVGPLTIDSDVKKFLFCLNHKDCHPVPPEGYQWLVIGQNLLSIILVFFIGLALRNYFRIK